jgi:peptidoglycan/LPS O-acetylase OafA/YrhL
MATREESAFSGEPADQRPRGKPDNRIPVLDGWRASSILLVLGAHLVPLGPHWMRLNDTAGAMGMALFFTLSGFLITSFLAGGMAVGDFLARRLARIVPLCWAAVTLLVLWHRFDLTAIIRNYLFVANLPPVDLLEGGEHLWSLGVEMQFYMTVALICLIFGRRGLYLVPVLALVVTSARVMAGERISIVTWHRIDEILAGGIIALIYAGWFGTRASQLMKKLPVWPFALALVACSHPGLGPMMYFRPYAAAFLVGASLSNCPAILHRLLVSRPMAWVAEISYALYVIHGVLSATWLGSGDKTAKYLKRPLLFGATFLLAHLSTRYYEQPITRRVRNWTKARRQRRADATAASRSAAASHPAG